MKEQKLLELATLLYFISEDEQVSERFDMTIFRRSLPPVPICETSACAFGWAGELYPKQIKWASYREISCIYPTYKGYKHEKAIMKFFEISCDSADALFYPGLKQTPKKVADKIVKYVEKHSKE